MPDLDIVDTQVHLNRLTRDRVPGDVDVTIAAAVTAMDALGISAVLIDEDTGHDAKGRLGPARELADGSYRFTYDFAERAVAAWPQRFGYLAKVDPLDRDLDGVVARIAANPHQHCLRVIPSPTNGELDRFAAGGYRDLFRAARRHGLPAFVWLPGRAQLLEPYAREFADVQLIVDHCGVALPAPGDAPDGKLEGLPAVIALARHSNVSLKWCKAYRLSREPYPYRDLIPPLLRILDAFGRERVMWASDATQMTEGHTWADALYSILDSAELSESDKTWILGRSARTLLRWPAPSVS